MNADQQELQKFNALAETWWHPDGEFRSLHKLNPLRLQWIESITPVAGKKVLDIGCGGGILSEAIAKKGGIVTGIDMADEVIQAARKHARLSALHIDYRTTSAENLSLQEKNQYDVITCLEMLEHVPDPATVIHACSTLIKPEGTVFFATLNRNLKSFLYAIIGAEYIMRLLPKGTHHHDRFLKPSELSRLARKAGLNVKSIIGIGCDFSGSHFYLRKDTRINYMIACTRSH